MHFLPALALPCLLALAACTTTPAATAGDAAVSGAIRIGTQAMPAMRVCAMPVDGGTDRCIETPAGADRYRIDGLAAGRYYLVGWIDGGELRLVAHASTIRCVRAPCPPDALIAVDVPAAAQVDGIDLTAPYVEVPAGWPGEPARRSSASPQDGGP